MPVVLAEELLERKLTGRYLRACLSTREKRELQQSGHGQCGETVTKEDGSLDSENVLLVEREGDLVWFKLNRSKVANCLNRPLLKALIDACNEVAKDRSVRVVAIIGAGKKAFLRRS